MNESSRTTEDQLDRQRALILDWLRVPHRDPQFLMKMSPEELGRFHETIAQRFLDYVLDAGFQAQVVEVTPGGRAAYEVRWTHRGSDFVGFKQPAAEENSGNALLAGCAALLENEWCRARLPH